MAEVKPGEIKVYMNCAPVVPRNATEEQIASAERQVAIDKAKIEAKAVASGASFFCESRGQDVRMIVDGNKAPITVAANKKLVHDRDQQGWKYDTYTRKPAMVRDEQAVDAAVSKAEGLYFEFAEKTGLLGAVRGTGRDLDVQVTEPKPLPGTTPKGRNR